MQPESRQCKSERLTLDLWPTVGALLGLGRNAVYKAAKRGDVPVLRIGGRLLVPRAALERLIEGNDVSEKRGAA